LAKSRNLNLIASSVFITLVSAIAAYYRAFSSLALYDDEGTMMMTVKRFFEGNALYDQVASVYGPLYYSTNGRPTLSPAFRFRMIPCGSSPSPSG
jgi:hypothetical protein